jgi:hypothetical protein
LLDRYDDLVEFFDEDIISLAWATTCI